MTSTVWDLAEVKAVSDAYGGAIFLITRPRGLDALVLHAAGPGDGRRAIRAAERLGARVVSVRRHPPALLASPRSLAALMQTLAGAGQIVADPTGAASRAAQLVETAERARLVLPRRLLGLYLNPSRGIVFGWMREPPAAEASRTAMEAILAEVGADWACVVLSPVLPSRGVVPVDDASRQAAKSRGLARRAAKLLGATAAGVGLGGALAGMAAADPTPTAPPSHADDPLFQAVFTGGGGSLGRQGFGSLEASGGAYGHEYVQVDAKGIVGGNAAGGAGALQLGFRDPEYYRAGVFVAVGGEGRTFYQGGAYADVFVDQLNLRIIGREIGVENGPSRFFVGGGVDYYFDENSKMYGEAEIASDNSMGRAGVEHTFQSLAGTTVGAEGIWGNGNDGVKVYARWWFGAPGESLQHHDRYGPAKSVLDDAAFREARRLAGAHYGGATPSDRRLKHDITALGRLDNGIQLYRFSYLGDSRPFVGVMAQDLLADRRFAGAVVCLANGLMMVDYDRLGLEVDDLDAMREAGDRAIAAHVATMAQAA
ncbi:MAG: tail fiber domain-containing protein [Caulobacterales bacterium]